MQSVFPRIFSIEGNIGSGKTTLFNKLRKEMESQTICFVKEPVDEWEKIKDNSGESILSLFYKDKKSNAFTFQVMAYLTIIKEIKKCIEENPKCKIIICERSFISSQTIFTNMLHDDGYISDVQYQIYKLMCTDCPFNLAGTIHLDVSPETCARRIISRGRKGEEEIPMDYLEKCQQYHNMWMNKQDYVNILETNFKIEEYRQLPFLERKKLKIVIDDNMDLLFDEIVYMVNFLIDVSSLLER